MIFEVVNGSFGYLPGHEILHNLNFQVPDGKILSILGPNGVGKTTLLRCMMGLLHWKKGESRIDGEDIRKMPVRRIWKKIAYVPQAKGNALMYTAEEMVLLGRCAHLGMMQQPGREDIETAREAMALVGVTHLKEKLCSQMSGGELQMILIARALTTKPSMLVLDEPESNLDFKNQLIILDTIKKLSQEKRISCVFNTHYPDHALKISDEALLLDKSGRCTFGSSRDVINCENMQRSFEVEVYIDHLKVKGTSIASVVPLALL